MCAGNKKDDAAAAVNFDQISFVHLKRTLGDESDNDTPPSAEIKQKGSLLISLEFKIHLHPPLTIKIPCRPSCLPLCALQFLPFDETLINVNSMIYRQTMGHGEANNINEHPREDIRVWWMVVQSVQTTIYCIQMGTEKDRPVDSHYVSFTPRHKQ